MLFPNYFKKVGIIISIGSVFFGIIAKQINLLSEPDDIKLFRTISFDVIILGLLFIAFAKEELETEITQNKRYRTLLFSSIWVVYYVLIKSVVDVLDKETIQETSYQKLVFLFLFSFVCIYNFDKFYKPKNN